jgi:transposase
LALRDWLEAQRVTLVGMEAIGVYWKPVFHMLEDSMECWLNARHLRDVHVRKIDMADAGWIATGRARAGAAELRAAGADP